MITLKPNETYRFPIKNGYLDIGVSQDPYYPGLDIEYISDKEECIPNDKHVTRPRVLIENNENVLRALIWGDINDEDYSHDIDFTCVEDLVENSGGNNL